jgi:hypothetical protein
MPEYAGARKYLQPAVNCGRSLSGLKSMLVDTSDRACLELHPQIVQGFRPIAIPEQMRQVDPYGRRQ